MIWQEIKIDSQGCHSVSRKELHTPSQRTWGSQIHRPNNLPARHRSMRYEPSEAFDIAYLVHQFFLSKNPKGICESNAVYSTKRKRPTLTNLPTFSLASQGNGKRETTTDARVSFSRYAGKTVVYIRRVRWYSEVWEWERRAACRMIAQTLQTKMRWKEMKGNGMNWNEQIRTRSLFLLGWVINRICLGKGKTNEK